MTQHLCPEFDPTCYRCDLARDEMPTTLEEWFKSESDCFLEGVFADELGNETSLAKFTADALRADGYRVVRFSNDAKVQAMLLTDSPIAEELT